MIRAPVNDCDSDPKFASGTDEAKDMIVKISVIPQNNILNIGFLRPI